MTGPNVARTLPAGAATRRKRSAGYPATGAADSSRTVATVERAADVLLHFARMEAPTLGVTEIAGSLSMSKAAVHRILSSLRSRGLIQVDEATRRYSLGPMAMVLGLSYLARLDVRRLAAPELRQLSARTNETATLSVRTGDSRVYVDQVTPAREVIMSVSIGIPFPLHAGGSSKAFLAFLPDEEVDAYLRRRLTALTENTITDKEKLRAELALIRKRGWAHSSAERQTGAASVAAPVFDHAGQPCAVISVCGPAERFSTEVDRCATALLAVTAHLSAKMGHVRR